MFVSMGDNIITLGQPNSRLSSEPEARAIEASLRVDRFALIVGIVLAGRTKAVPVEDVRPALEKGGLPLEPAGGLHRCLAVRAGETVDLSDYLRDVAQSAVEALPFPGRTHLSLDIAARCPTDSNTAVLIGLCVNELITNAIKHAHPSGVAGLVLIGCNRSGDRIVVEIADDGIGFPEGFRPASVGQGGLHLVRTLAFQLGAQLAFEDTGIGVRARLRIPTHREG
jgi:hypothetical protein